MGSGFVNCRLLSAQCLRWLWMVEVEVDFVKVQPKKSGAHMVTIPADVIKTLEMKRNERVKVLVEKEKRRIIYNCCKHLSTLPRSKTTLVFSRANRFRSMSLTLLSATVAGCMELDGGDFQR